MYSTELSMTSKGVCYYFLYMYKVHWCTGAWKFAAEIFNP